MEFVEEPVRVEESTREQEVSNDKINQRLEICFFTLLNIPTEILLQDKWRLATRTKSVFTERVFSKFHPPSLS